jgi:energy-coupling factor transporter ATP-binding protein EcfA2
MPRRRSTKSIPPFKENPYTQFDSSLSPKWTLWQLYKQPVSYTGDERLYSNGALRLLVKYGTLLEESRQIEKEFQKEEDGDVRHFYPESLDSGTSLYLYKHNIVRVALNDDETVEITCYYPVSRQCVIDEFKKFLIEEKGESRVSVLISRNGGLVASNITFAAPAIPDVELNYGTGFKKVYDKLVEKLKEQKGGLILMHGDPGTGKSYLLKHLTSIVDREFVFVGASMIPRLSDPELVSLLLNKKGAVLILEDAEQAIQKRTDSSDASTTSTILNLTEGFLSSVLGLTVIASYNVDSSRVDSALLRKGRLLYRHSFTALSIEDAKKLAAHLGKKMEITRPTTIADIYCSDEQVNDIPPEESRQMGFHTLINEPTLKNSAIKDKNLATEKS